jgi:magnesium-transporting ATPase (P-type)
MPSVPRQQQVRIPAAGMTALASGFMLIFVLIGIALYVYYALSMYLIAKKLNVAEAWMSWIPILNLWPFLTSAGKPCWWVLLLFIPIVNILIIIYLWMCICENLGRNKWLGLLTLVPVVNLVLPGVLAFSKSE